MKKVILLIIVIILLTGCGGSDQLYNISNFILPNDVEFLNLIGRLDTPEKTCKYMNDNFEYESNLIILTPYQLSIIKKGCCDDFSLFTTFIAHYHNYETYQILIKFPLNMYVSQYHMMGIFKEGDYYNISDNMLYIECFCESFKEIMNFNLYHGWIYYKVYDYDMNIIETVYNK